MMKIVTSFHSLESSLVSSDAELDRCTNWADRIEDSGTAAVCRRIAGLVMTEVPTVADFIWRLARLSGNNAK